MTHDFIPGHVGEFRDLQPTQTVAIPHVAPMRDVDTPRVEVLTLPQPCKGEGCTALTLTGRDLSTGAEVVIHRRPWRAYIEIPRGTV